MALFRRSLCEDRLDQYHHMWSVLFFMFLAIVTWLLPLSPHLQPQAGPSNQVVFSQGAAKTQENPKVKVSCWCPVEFTSAMVAYTEASCGGAYVLALQGVDLADHDHIGAKLFHNLPFDRILPIDREDLIFNPGARNTTDSQQHQGKVKLPVVEDEKKQKTSEDTTYFIQTEAPFALFLLAVCLKIPHLVWTLLSSMSGGINIDQTLRSAQAGTGLDHESRRQLYRDLAATTAQKVRACPWRTSCVYLLVKNLMCIAVVAELLVVHQSLLPQAKSLESKLQQKHLDDDIKITTNSASEEKREHSHFDADYYRENSNRLLLCDFKLRQIQNIQTFLVQCIFQLETPSSVSTRPTQDKFSNPTRTTWSSPVGVVKLYETMFLIVQTVLVVLTLINVTSCLVWLLKLLTPCRKSVVSDLDLPLDACLLVHMAQENAGPEVVSAFTHSGAWSRDGGKESEALNE